MMSYFSSVSLQRQYHAEHEKHFRSSLLHKLQRGGGGGGGGSGGGGGVGSGASGVSGPPGAGRTPFMTGTLTLLTGSFHLFSARYLISSLEDSAMVVVA